MVDEGPKVKRERVQYVPLKGSWDYHVLRVSSYLALLGKGMPSALLERDPKTGLPLGEVERNERWRTYLSRRVVRHGYAAVESVKALVNMARDEARANPPRTLSSDVHALSLHVTRSFEALCRLAGK